MSYTLSERRSAHGVALVRIKEIGGVSAAARDMGKPRWLLVTWLSRKGHAPMNAENFETFRRYFRLPAIAVSYPARPIGKLLREDQRIAKAA